MADEPLKVAICAQLGFRGESGGIERFVGSLIHALGQADDGSQEYQVMALKPTPAELEAMLGPNQRVVPATNGLSQPQSKSGPLGKLGGLFKGKAAARRYKGPERRIPAEDDGTIASMKVDVIHFPYQWIIQSDVPTIYNPHDLQHRHYPEFFSDEELDQREKIHAAACRLSTAVVAESSWGKVDLVKQYGVSPDKVHTILRGSPTESYDPLNDAEVQAAKEKHALPDRFVLYPAQPWPHKNHLRLLEALKLFEHRHGVQLPLVCTGSPNDYQAKIKQRCAELGLTDRVQFLGYVSAAELRALYKLCRFVVFPSLFEGGGFPVMEAFYDGAPIACSTVTSLPEYGGDAVLGFDPESVDSITDALHRLDSDEELRKTLAARGSERVKEFTWRRTAMAYRALYKQAAGRLLSHDEQRALAAAAGGSGRNSSARQPQAV